MNTTTDGPLSASRYGDNGNSNNSFNHRGGDRYGNYNSNNHRHSGNYHGNRHHNNYNRHNPRRGGGRGRGGRHYYHRGGGRSRYHNQNNHYHHRGGGGGGPRNSGNRFNTSNSASIDPENAMLKQLSAMVATMGDWSSASASVNPPVESSSTNDIIMDEINNDASDEIIQSKMEEQSTYRQTVLQTIARNVTDLSSVLTSPQTAPQFLKFTPPPSTSPTTTDAAEKKDDNDEDTTPASSSTMTTTSFKNLNEEKKAGPLATLLVACAYALPLQTASYAALTMEVEKGVRSHEQPNYKGFAQRCLQMACVRLHVDLTRMLMLQKVGSNDTNDATLSGADNGINISSGSPAECFRRCKFILRYLALLLKAGLLHAHYDKTDSNNSSTDDLDTNIITESKNMGMMDLLQYLTERYTDLGGSPEGAMLAYLILSTIPYLLDASSIDKMQLQSMLNSISHTASEYQSPYKPGEGVLSILLKEEPNDEDEEDEDSDEEDEEEDAPCCDSLQELLRTNHTLLQNPNDALFGALTDAPWINESNANNETDNEINTCDDSSMISLYLPFLPLSTVYIGDQSLLPLPHHPLASIILGRLPLYPPPPTDDDDDNDDDEENSSHKPQTPYVTNFTLSARTFLNDSIRDILHCHHPTISPSGLERGSCKNVAQQIWSLNLLFAPYSIHGMEFGIVECFLSLIAQSHQLFANTTKSAANLTRVYISRVLLELTNLYPTKIPQALAISVAMLVENILPSLVPQCAHVLANWFAFHLVNTDFQWPKEYWDYWAQEENMKGCKKEFFTRVLEVMSSLAGKKAIKEDCLPPDSPLIGLLVTKKKDTNDENSGDTNVSHDLQKELKDRMWLEMEPSQSLDDWMMEYDDSFEDAKSRDGDFWRAKIVIRALLSPPGLRMTKDDGNDRTYENDEDMGDDEGDHEEKDDPLQDLLAGLRRYAPLVTSSIMKGLTKVESKEKETPNKDDAEAAVLEQIQDSLKNNLFATLSMVDAVYEAVLEHKIVSPIGFLKFSISESSLFALSEWYQKARLCAKYSVTSIIASITEGVAMILDSDDVSSRISDIVNQVADNLAPLMEYACKRVFHLLLSSTYSKFQSGKKIKLTREIVLLVEGLKQMLWEGQVHCCKLLRAYFQDGPGKMLLGTSELDDDMKKTVKEILGNTVGGKMLKQACKDEIEDFNNNMEVDVHRGTEQIEKFIFPWMEKLLVS